jgi:hypothetical protein
VANYSVTVERDDGVKHTTTVYARTPEAAADLVERTYLVHYGGLVLSTVEDKPVKDDEDDDEPRRRPADSGHGRYSTGRR